MKDENSLVKFDFRTAILKAITTKVIKDLSNIITEGKISRRKFKMRAENFKGEECRVHISIEKIGAIYIECETLDPYFYCPFPKRVYLSELDGNIKKGRFLEVLQEAMA